MDWKGNSMVFKGYATGTGKKATMKVKDAQLLSWDDVQGNQSFGAILNQDFVDISFDTDELSQKFWDMAEKNNWNCLILENPENGHIHSYWKDTEHRIEKGGKDKKLAVGLIADIHSGSTYIPLRVNGVDRFPPSFEPDDIDEVPDELLPVNTQIDLLNLAEGDGRNDSLFRYILVLQGAGMEEDTIRRVLENANEFILSESLGQDELDIILRDEAFEKPVFYKGKTFLHDKFGDYMIRQHHIKRINGQLHCYRDGIYITGGIYIENLMTDEIRSIKANQRTEVLKYIGIRIPDSEDVMMQENLIAFRNGILNIKTDELIPFSPEYIVTNKIPWDYNPNAYDELMDSTLNKISCNDHEIRALLEECAGYCLYRKNKLQKAFILTGSGSNGKSTFLEALKCMLGRPNYSALELAELDDRFSTAMMAGKLANIGDDISDEFLHGKTLSVFKKIVSANDIKAENKGQDAFTFKPYTKLLFSANNIPRIKVEGFEAIKRRLLIIPFNAKFSKDDDDYNPDIEDDLKTESAMEYFILLALQGLKRALYNKCFTEPSKVKDEVEQFEKDNNPVLEWLESLDEDDVISYLCRNSIQELTLQFDVFCRENGHETMKQKTFINDLKKRFNLKSERSTVCVNGHRPSILKPVTL